MKAMRFSRATWGWIAFGAALIAFAIYAAVHWFEVVDDTEWIGVKGEARVNPYLALEKLLVAQGASVNPLRSISSFDDQLAESTSRVLILADKRLAYMTPARVAAIERWVAAGGHLIVEGEALHLDDPLLMKWSVDRKRLIWRRGRLAEADRKRPDEASKKGQANSGADTSGDDPEMEFPVEPMPSNGRRPRSLSPFAQNQTAMPTQSTARVTLPDGMTFRAVFSAYQNFVLLPAAGAGATAQATLIRDRTGGRIVEIPVGRGRVTAISNFDFIAWKGLAGADHAELIWHLVSDGGERVRPSVAMMTRPLSTGFATWLGVNAWMVLVSLAALIVFWIWHVLPRFGPLLPAAVPSRRRLGEHIRAAGGWLAKRGEWSQLIEPVRARFWSRMILRHPRAAAMSVSERLQLAASLTGLSFADLTRLLTADVPTRRDCLHSIRTLIKATARLDSGRARVTGRAS